MPLSEEFMEYVCDQFDAWGDVSARKMFGGAGLYHKGVMFGLIADDVAYLKVDDTNRADFEAAGCAPFRPFDNKTMTMSYYDIPVDVLEDRELLPKWAVKAHAIAVRTKKA